MLPSQISTCLPVRHGPLPPAFPPASLSLSASVSRTAPEVESEPAAPIESTVLCAANHAPLSFLERTALVYPDRSAVVASGPDATPRTWRDTRARCLHLASALSITRCDVEIDSAMQVAVDLRTGVGEGDDADGATSTQVEIKGATQFGRCQTSDLELIRFAD